MRGLFVTGTDTGIGKTVISAALLVRYRSARLRYWKPIQTGIEQDDDTATVLALAGGAGQVLDQGIRLPRPLSPHLSARLQGVRITLEPLLRHAAAQPETERLVVEGAGGLLVPLNESTVMADLIIALDLPVLVVARSTLGTINHTLLTLEALRARGRPIAGVIMNGPLNDDNRQAIESYGGVDVIAQIPSFDHIRRETIVQIASLIDPNGLLWERAFR